MAEKRPKYQKRHYEEWARALQSRRPSRQYNNPTAQQWKEWRYSVDLQVAVAEADNPNFDRARFLIACGAI